ncbi:sigma 54-interacting transcriptional regulator [Caballeronia sp. LjRoot29]|uniref:sigma-54 dependent transcriptional regulator n=1 Tax=Caballeronia sp. LjRoot29 TaxID=3342315 RepID=UPI003ECF1DA6
MNEDGRTLYYVGEEMAASLRTILGDRAWRVETIGPANDFGCARQFNSASAGLFDFSTFPRPLDLPVLRGLLSHSRVGWVAICHPTQIEDADVLQLIRDYFFTYVTLPRSNNRIIDAIGHAYGMASLHERAWNDQPNAHSEDHMIGACDGMLGLFNSIRKIAMTDAPVFISGESGTGKELTAVAIHARSMRRDRPFTAVNCGAIPPHLLQSELFGYERGAFTGANQRKIGRVEAANGGTLFLDEIGDLPLESQASLLRFLQERTVERLGGHAATPVDVRIISATHVKMQTAMNDGRFRADLFHRLCVLQIEEPPLRMSGKDIELLANHMLERFRKDACQRVRGFAPDAITAINTYAWPGNVRELINRVRRAIVMSNGRQIRAADLELGEHAEGPPISLARAREAGERQAIELALLRHRGRLGDAAKELGISRVTLYRLLTTHALRVATAPADFDMGDVPRVNK